jgi:hypothetical protein
MAVAHSSNCNDAIELSSDFVYFYFYLGDIVRREAVRTLGLMYRVPIFWSSRILSRENWVLYGTTCALVAFIRLLHIQSTLPEMCTCTDQLSTVTNTTWIELIPFPAHDFFGTSSGVVVDPPVTFFFRQSLHLSAYWCKYLIVETN